MKKSENLHIKVGSKYINSSTSVRNLGLYWILLDWTMTMHCYINTLPTPGDTHSQKGTNNTSFVTAALASYMFQITVQDPVSHLQSTEWNSITISKRSNSKVYTSENLSPVHF